MNRPSLVHLLVSILFLALLSPFFLSVYATPPYTVGIAEGQWAIYAPVNVTYHEIGVQNHPEPESIKDLNLTDHITATVQHLYSPKNVTIQSVSTYKNSTTRTIFYNGDVSTGNGNLTFGLIAGGLSAGDHIWTGAYSVYTPTINQTILMSYLGLTRPVNILNFTQRPYGNLVVNLVYVWDQASGITLESKILAVLHNSSGDGAYLQYTDVKIQSTNIFSNPSTPDFALTVASPPSVASGVIATFTITIAPFNGFTDTVTLTDTVPAGLSCDTISPNTISGSRVVYLSCYSALRGTYNVTITGSSGLNTHTRTATIKVTAAPSQTPPAPATILGLAPTIFFAIIAVILAIAGTGGHLILRSRSQTRQTATN
ncbi:MAG TPA: hypothetical protein VGS11_03525 [Candidatus Bathyarchaeia archaeon]|nr:hypothetical protein [Candidatus Bathyarchaeia archaeon]